MALISTIFKFIVNSEDVCANVCLISEPCFDSQRTRMACYDRRREAGTDCRGIQHQDQDPGWRVQGPKGMGEPRQVVQYAARRLGYRYSTSSTRRAPREDIKETKPGRRRSSGTASTHSGIILQTLYFSTNNMSRGREIDACSCAWKPEAADFGRGTSRERRKEAASKRRNKACATKPPRYAAISKTRLPVSSNSCIVSL